MVGKSTILGDRPSNYLDDILGANSCNWCLVPSPDVGGVFVGGANYAATIYRGALYMATMVDGRLFARLYHAGDR